MGRIPLLGLLLGLGGCVSVGDPAVWTYQDIAMPHGRSRGEGAEQLATQRCDGGNPDRIGGPAFNQCMLKQGWRLASHTPAGPRTGTDDADDPDYLTFHPPIPNG